MVWCRKITSCKWVSSVYTALNNISHTRLCSTMTSNVHQTAKDGFKQGNFYDQNRPSYTDGLVSHVVQSLSKANTPGMKYNVLELGAGTGLFTRKLWPQLEKGSTYLATEPSQEFLSVLKQQSPGVEAMECSSTDIPLPDQSVQNVICAQCFHWFANTESLQEITRVLVPKGRLILVWNNKDWSIDWVQEIEAILTEYYDDTPRAITKQWKTVIEGYKPLKCVEHDNLPGISSMKGDKDFIVNHFMSISVVAKQEDQVRQSVRARFRAVLDKYFPDVNELQIPFNSEFYCVEKL